MQWIIHKRTYFNFTDNKHSLLQTYFADTAKKCTKQIKRIIYSLLSSGNWEFHPEPANFNLDIQVPTRSDTIMWQFINNYGDIIIIRIICAYYIRGK